MATPSSSYDVVILGSGIAGLAGALAAHELGLKPVVLEKAAALGGGTVHSYGLIWVGQNYLARNAGIADSHDEVLTYLRFLSGGAVDEARLAAFVARSLRYLSSLWIAGSASGSCMASPIIITKRRPAPTRWAAPWRPS
jgi:3-oxosteroid 1-dehydrogenase